MNLWGRGLLQQWNIQINIPAAPKTYISEENNRRYYIWRTRVIRAVQEHKAVDIPSDVSTVLPSKWLTEKPISFKQWPLAEEKL